MAVTLWSNTYLQSDFCFLKQGGAISCGLKKVGSTYTLQTKFSSDGVTWPPDSEAVEVATGLTKNAFYSIRQRSEAGSSDIEIYGRDGTTDKLWRSAKLGRDGSWVAV